MPYPPPGYPVPPGFTAPLAVAQPTFSRIEPLPGTTFAIGYPAVSPTLSGPAVGSLVAGIGSVMVSVVVACFGQGSTGSGMGPVVAGAFAVLAGLVGLGGLGLGIFGARQARRSGGQVTGFGLAIAGITCASVGLVVTVLAMVASLLL